MIVNEDPDIHVGLFELPINDKNDFIAEDNECQHQKKRWKKRNIFEWN